MSYATVDDVAALWRPLSGVERERVGNLLPVVESLLNTEAKRVGRDLAEAAAADEDFSNTVKSVVVDVVARTLMTSTEQEPMTQFSQTAGPFSASGTFLVPGGGIFIKKSELARLGLRRQRIGALDIYGHH